MSIARCILALAHIARTRNSSAVIDERVNQLATTVTVRREQQLGTDFMLRRFGGHSD
jgi:hypothetical protein